MVSSTAWSVVPCVSLSDLVDSVHWHLDGVSQLVVLEAPPRDLVAQVLHVFLHLKEIRDTDEFVKMPANTQTIINHLYFSVQEAGTWDIKKLPYNIKLNQMSRSVHRTHKKYGATSLGVTLHGLP